MEGACGREISKGQISAPFWAADVHVPCAGLSNDARYHDGPGKTAETAIGSSHVASTGGMPLFWENGVTIIGWQTFRYDYKIGVLSKICVE